MSKDEQGWTETRHSKAEGVIWPIARSEGVPARPGSFSDKQTRSVTGAARAQEA